MPPPISPFIHTGRLYVDPFPSTAAGTLAILKHLKQYGNVAILRPKHQRPSAAVTDDTSQQNASNDPQSNARNARSPYYTVAFTSLTPLGSSLPETKTLPFKVTSNIDAPDPVVEDPYNIRGLLSRKPIPQPETFACTLRRHREEFIEPRPPRTGDDTRSPYPRKPVSSLSRVLQSPEYSRGFRVQTTDPFQRALKKSQTPPVLVRGLLELREDVQTDNNYRRRNGKGAVVVSLRKYNLAAMYREAMEGKTSKDFLDSNNEAEKTKAKNVDVTR